MRERLGSHLFLKDNRAALDDLETLEQAGENMVVFLEDGILIPFGRSHASRQC